MPETGTRSSASGPSPIEEISGVLAYFEGRVVPLEEATVSIATHGLNYGTGCFEGIRAYWNEEEQELYALQLEAHYRRFLDSCRLLRIDPGKGLDELVAITRDLLRRGDVRTDAYIRPIAFKASQVIKVGLSHFRDAFGIYYLPMGDYLPTGGLSLQVSPWQRISDNAIPSRSKTTGSYVNASLAADGAQALGYHDAILLGADGHVSEASGANIFLVRKGRLVTPPVTADILEGITRDLILGIASDLGIETDVRIVDRTELYVAEEVLLVGTGVQVAPVTSIDRRPVGDGTIGPVARSLQETYFRAVRGREPKYRSWLTPVHGRAT